MCSEVMMFPGRVVVDSIADLSERLGVLPVDIGGDEWNGETDHCLCPVDIQASCDLADVNCQSVYSDWDTWPWIDWIIYPKDWNPEDVRPY